MGFLLVCILHGSKRNCQLVKKSLMQIKCAVMTGQVWVEPAAAGYSSLTTVEERLGDNGSVLTLPGEAHRYRDCVDYLEITHLRETGGEKMQGFVDVRPETTQTISRKDLGVVPGKIRRRYLSDVDEGPSRASCASSTNPVAQAHEPTNYQHPIPHCYLGANSRNPNIRQR